MAAPPAVAVPTLAVDARMETPLVGMASVRCRAGVSGCGDEEPVESPRLIFPRRGLFVYHLKGRTWVADPHAIFLLDPMDTCRISHPLPGGDDCSVIVPSLDILDEALHGRHWLEPDSRATLRFGPKRVEASPEIQLGLRALQAHLLSGGEPLLGEELALFLLAHLGEQAFRIGDPQRRYVERARAFLAAEPARNASLDRIAQAVQCSPFHLARAFRRVTGTTLHQFQTHLRMGEALDRLAQGEEDLSRLAQDLGFSSHSHFSARFRQTFGLRPGDVRRTLTQPRLETWRRILTAVPGAKA